MKVLFATSSEYYKNSPIEFKKIKQIIESIPNTKLYTITDKKADSIKTDSDIKDLIKYGQKIMKDCDVVIAEADFGSAGLGYDIAKVIDMKKPVLILSEEKIDKNKTPHPIRINSRLLTYRSYTFDTLKSVVDKFLKDAKKQLDTKFILIISPEIDRYLEWTGENRRMHKAQVVRGAVEETMRKDKEYKEYLKSV